MVSDSCDPVDWESTKLLCPWDSPDKNTGVGLESCFTLVTPIRRASLPNLEIILTSPTAQDSYLNCIRMSNDNVFT